MMNSHKNDDDTLKMMNLDKNEPIVYISEHHTVCLMHINVMAIHV